METINGAITVNAAADAAYEQWCRLEEFPRFIQGLEQVQRRDERHVHWRAEAWGRPIEWDAEITEAVQDRLFAWKSTAGVENSGFVRFEPMDETHTRVSVQITYEPAGVLRSLDHQANLARRRLDTELEHFKVFLESHGQDAGP